MATPQFYTIGELSREVGLPVETIRYYEREGLVPKPRRSGGNYRLYSETHRERLSFIRHCRSLDMTLDEVRSLLAYKDAPTGSCGEVNALLDSHIQHVAERISELRRLRKQLQALRDTCGAAKQAKDCAILAGLARGTRTPPAKRSARTQLTEKLS